MEELSDIIRKNLHRNVALAIGDSKLYPFGPVFCLTLMEHSKGFFAVMRNGEAVYMFDTTKSMEYSMTVKSGSVYEIKWGGHRLVFELN